MTRARPDLDVAPFTLEYPTRPLVWNVLFGNDHPVELEVGPGKGLFLANTGRLAPSHNFVGVEVSRKYAAPGGRAGGQARAGQCPGRRRRCPPVPGRVRPPRSLRAVHIYFPDPWWKTRHRKRRVFCTAFVHDVARALEVAGTFHMATDVADYFQVMQALMTARPEFTPLAPPEPRTPEHELDYLTNFERKYRIAGRSIYRAGFRFAPPRG